MILKRFRVLRQASKVKFDLPKRVIRLKYEDLVFDYEETVVKLFKFLGEPRKKHINAGNFFSPKKAKLNTKVWKNHHRPEDINKIVTELAEWCDRRID